MSPATFGVLHREHGDFGVSPWSFTQVLEMIFPREIPSFLRKHHLSMDIRTLRLIWRRIEAPVWQTQGTTRGDESTSDVSCVVAFSCIFHVWKDTCRKETWTLHSQKFFSPCWCHQSSRQPPELPCQPIVSPSGAGQSGLPEKIPTSMCGGSTGIPSWSTWKIIPLSKWSIALVSKSPI